MQRKFNRDSLRKEVGNRGLKWAWMRFQQKKYGWRYDKITKTGRE